MLQRNVPGVLSTSIFLQTLLVASKLCNVLSVTTKSFQWCIAFSEYLWEDAADSILSVANDND